MLPPVDIAFIAEELFSHSEELLEAFEDHEDDGDSDPEILLQALRGFFDGMRLFEVEAPNLDEFGSGGLDAGKDIQALGNYGIDLLGHLSALARHLGLPKKGRAVEELALPLACWIARRGAELANLGAVVNGAASLANRLEQPSELGQLYGLLTEIVNAVNPQIPQEPGSAAPNHPWRILLINRAIVATRSHQPTLMEEAFESIIEFLSGEAPNFFREGMEQMGALNYPPRVQALMRRYFDQWCGSRVLH